MSLQTGVLLLPPDPVLSPDLIQPFDAVKSQLQDVFPTPQPFPNSLTGENEKWLPVAPVPPPVGDPTKPWNDVVDLWNTPNLGEGAGEAAVKGWGSAMGWGEGSVVGTVPARLVAGLTGLYVAAPMVAVAGAA